MINRKTRNTNNPLLKPQITEDTNIEDTHVISTQKKLTIFTVLIGVKKILFKIFFKSPFKKLILPVVIISLMYSAFNFYSKESEGEITSEKKVNIEDTPLTITEKVGKLILLPDYTPEVFKVSNVETLKTKQPFFEKAENDDTVLVYKNEVVLYRESINKIINVAPVSKNKSGVTTIQNNI